MTASFAAIWARLLRNARYKVLLAVFMPALMPFAATAQPDRNTHPDLFTQPSQFQRLLDAEGISLRLPPRGKAIVVNIPAFELIVFEDAKPIWRSRVIVGTPWHPTPQLETYTTSVRIRPTWRPTPSMVASGEYEDRLWPPGPRNPLGLAAVRLEPGLLIYLHDTNRRELFAEDMRALSHGCIRVQLWDDLVAWVLDLPIETVHHLANGTVTFDIPTETIPVTFGYFLEFPDHAGRIIEYPNIYELTPPFAISSSDQTTMHAKDHC